MHPSDNPRSVCKQLLYTAVNEMLLSDSNSQLPKIIFFVSRIYDTINMRDDIHIWLKERNIPLPTKKIISSYHGDMPSTTRKEIEEKFHNGELRILCTTIAYALGVNPAGVKYVFQQGHCSTDEALQKLGRASRGTETTLNATFIWVPEKKVIGPQMCDLSVDEQRLAGQSRAKKPTIAYQNIPTWNSQSKSGSNDDSIKATGSSKRKRALPKNAPPALWRQERLQPGEYRVYNPSNPKCHWATLLELYDERLDNTNDATKCNNCFACQPSHFSLT